MNVEYMGNVALMEREMTAFLAPSWVTPLSVLPTLDWATAMSHGTRPVVSGFTSRLEKEVFAVLVRGTAPIVLVIVPQRYKRVPAHLQPLLDSERLLIISLGLGTRLNRQLAAKRNNYVLKLATDIVFPAIHEQSSLFATYTAALTISKPVNVLFK